ncbi:MAG: 2-oxo acid dehydrogenase subunit E2 [Planctomycetes bacterium]|nr:2-oxo acid dehydrogenase subunit E2 [Planctomycetota bacterium]
MAREFRLPDLGEGIAEAQIIRVMVKPGDTVALDQYLMEVETDKAAVEIPSPFAGVAKTIHVKEGQTVNVGEVIVTFDEAAGAAPPTAAPATRPAAPSTPVAAPAAETTPSEPATPARGKSTAAAAPAVRKLAREMGVDIDAIAGTGPGGRVTREDVERAGKPAPRPSPPGTAPTAPPPVAPVTRPTSKPAALPPGVPDVDKWGPVRKVPITQIRKTIAAQMTRSAYTAVHVTHGDEADITDLDRMRRGLNEATGDDPKLTIMTFLIRAVCVALRHHPVFNAGFEEESGHIVYKEYINIGVAVDTERGLIVPVIRNADQLTMRGIAAALRTIADRVRTNQFAIEDLRGGTFTITNVGALGGTFSTPIINYPEVAILGLGRSRTVPVLRNGQLAEALMLPLNLSFDHRVMDGANAARFTREIISYLELPARLLLD